MKAPIGVLLLALLLAVPVRGEIRAAARGGIFAGTGHDLVGTIELDARRGNWGLAPAYDLIAGGYGLHAVHVDVRRFLRSERRTFWIAAGPTFVSSNSSSETTWNLDAGLEWRNESPWEVFVAARYYGFELPVFRDVLEDNGAVISVGVSRRLHR